METSALPLEDVWQIEVSEPGIERRLHAFTSGQTVVVGRSRDCDLQLSAKSVSRHHCILAFKKTGVELQVDERAGQPPLINGCSLSENEFRLLSDKDEIKLGDVSLRVLPANTAEPAGNTLEAIPDVPDELPTSGQSYLTSAQTIAGTLGGVDVTSAGEENPSTGYLPEEVAKNVLEGGGSKQNFTVILLVLIVATVVVFWLGDIGGGGDEYPDNKATRVYDGSYFTMVLPRGWKCDTSGRSIVFYGAGGIKKRGAAISSVHDEQSKWWSYEKAFKVIVEKASEDLEFLKTVAWFEGDSEDVMGVGRIHRQSLSSLSYVSFRGLMKGKGEIQAMVYISSEDVVALFAWTPGKKMSTSHREMINSFGLKGLESDGIDRCEVIPDIVRNLTHDEVLLLVEEGERWYEKRAVAPGNGWRAYKLLLQAHYWYGQEANIGNMAYREEMIREWRDLSSVAEHLDSFYKKQRSYISAAQQAGDERRLRKLVIKLQAEIPDRTDCRWLWAQKQLAVQSKKSGGGFF